jgi:two-component system cell cycle response regulator
MLEQFSILVIDDNQDNRDLVEYLLRARGHSPRIATGGSEGVTMALAEPPDLILLDIRMPEMDGYDVVAALRAASALTHTRVVAITASAMAEDRKRITDAGFDGYIQKPIEPEAFVDQIEKFLPHVAAGYDESRP